ncbi:MAG: 2-C-methyl-D-erythritol 4-phosphate cytidylyltransferase [Pseudomonadota bacterium]|nr:2-C-methyl-D-erythritol 4-phosphate cytidylyltransferase [Pseudomonadota bacterium]
MGGALPKQYLPLAGRTVLEHSLEVLLRQPRISALVVAVCGGDQWWDGLRLDPAWPLLRVTGGEERCHSVLNGLRALAQRAAADDWVLVHDAARPCLRPSDLNALIDTLSDDPVGGLLAMPACDTMKRADAGGRVAATVDRSGLWHAQTPQMFRYRLLRDALEAAVAQGAAVTDEASAVEAAGFRPRLVAGHAGNIKITHPDDLALAEFYLRQPRDY